MTINEALHDAESRLKRTRQRKTKNPNTPRWEAEILLAHLLKHNRAWLLGHGSDQLSLTKKHTFDSWIKRRSQHEPLAYILGDQEFYGRVFTVTRDTLIPRPETEMLVEAIHKLLPPLSPLDKGGSTEHRPTVMWDVGTGSGALAVTLALEHSRATILASDISSKALTVAKHNATKFHVTDRITFFKGSLLTPAISRHLKQLCRSSDRSEGDPTGRPYQMIIIANLPYLPDKDAHHLMPDVTKYEPSSALFAGTDGLQLIRALLSQLASAQWHWSFSNITILLEFDPRQTKKLLVLSHKLFPEAKMMVHKDFGKRDRILEIISLLSLLPGI